MTTPTKQGIYEQIIIAGFGGQGIILAGKLMAQAAMNEGMEVTFMPAYGAEVRGGTSNCKVIIADKPIANPMVNSPTSLIVMNKASVTKFAPHIQQNGLLIVNSSLIDQQPDLDASIEILPIPADDIAIELSSPKSANMVVLGAYFKKTNVLSIDAAITALPQVLAKRYHSTIEANSNALKKGAEFAANYQPQLSVKAVNK